MNKDKILIACALEQETDGKLDDWNVIYTGCGKVNATYELTAELFLQKKISKLPKLVINFGTAGSRDIPIHTLVDCTKFVQRDIDASSLGFPKTMTPYESSVPHIINFSKVKNPINKKMSCGTGDSFVTSDKGVTTDVVDMEAYAIAKVCYLNDIDFISFKYITDDGNADDWKKNCGEGVKEFKKVLEYYDNN